MKQSFKGIRGMCSDWCKAHTRTKGRVNSFCLQASWKGLLRRCHRRPWTLSVALQAPCPGPGRRASVPAGRALCKRCTATRYTDFSKLHTLQTLQRSGAGAWSHALLILLCHLILSCDLCAALHILVSPVCVCLPMQHCFARTCVHMHGSTKCTSLQRHDTLCSGARRSAQRSTSSCWRSCGSRGTCPRATSTATRSATAS